MIKVSVIVPVFNAGSYLTDCLETLHAQTLKEMEVILVLDAPTDGSDSTARTFAQRDPRFVVVENEANLHIGLSRNRGLERAQGEFIAFCDHDDVMVPDMYERLYAFAKAEKADCVLSVPTLEEDGKKQYWSLEELMQASDQADTILRNLLSYGGPAQPISHYCYIHTGLYRNAFLKTHAIRFVDTRQIANEDVIFHIECMLHAPKIAVMNEPMYTHRLIASSTGHQREYLSWRKRYEEVAYVHDLLVREGGYERYKEDFLLMVQKKYIDGMISILLHGEGLCLWVRTYHFIRNTPYGKEAFRHYQDAVPRPLHKKIARRLIAKFLAL